MRVRLTGELQVETPAGRVRARDFPGRQGRLAFARLAATPHPVPRHDLAEVVWPGRPPRSWERDLSAVVSKIRALLSAVGIEEPVAAGLGCYQLALGNDAHVDVREANLFVEQAESLLRSGDVLGAHAAADIAVNHCVRPFLPGETGAWVEARRAEQHQVLLRSLHVLVDVHVRRGIFSEARRYAHRLVDLEPYQESGYAALIRAQVASGDRADALKAYERARTLLRDELGVPPGEVLDRAYREALEADAAPGAPAGDGAGGPSRPTGIVGILFADLTGPDRAVDTVERLREVVGMRSGHEVPGPDHDLAVVFTSARDAVACATGIQQTLRRDRGHGRGSARVGVHVGEVVFDGERYYGIPMAVTALICKATGEGEILASDAIRSVTPEPAGFAARREVALEGMNRPTVVWTVAWER